MSILVFDNELDNYNERIEEVIEETISDKIIPDCGFLGFCEVCGDIIQIPTLIEKEDPYSLLQNGLVQAKLLNEGFKLCSLCQLAFETLKKEERLGN